MSAEPTTKIGKRLFKLINGEVIFGECEVIKTEQGVGEILVKTPYTAENGNIMPYMVMTMANAPAAIQIHPMNILWQVPLTEFDEANKAYTKATTSIITEPDQKIVI